MSASVRAAHTTSAPASARAIAVAGPDALARAGDDRDPTVEPELDRGSWFASYRTRHVPLDAASSPHDRCREGNRRRAPVRLGCEHSRLRRVPRRRVGSAGGRRRPPLREALPRRVPVRPVVADDPAQARELPRARSRASTRSASRASATTTSSGCCGDAGIVRHRGKIEATIANARATLVAQREHGSLAALVLVVRTDGPAQRAARVRLTSRATTPESKACSKALLALGFRFVGPTTVYAAMQSLGIVNDHLVGCSARARVRSRARKVSSRPVPSRSPR